VIGYANDIQAAIVSRLKHDDALKGIIAGRVFDDVPATSEAPSPHFPYITTGQWAEVEDGTSTTHAVKFSCDLHVWSRAAGQQQLKDIMHVMFSLLHWTLMPIASGNVNWVMVENTQTMRDPDGETYHGIVRVTGRVEFGSYFPR
jgi:hypothetical protein